MEEVRVFRLTLEDLLKVLGAATIGADMGECEIQARALPIPEVDGIEAPHKQRIHVDIAIEAGNLDSMVADVVFGEETVCRSNHSAEEWAKGINAWSMDVLLPVEVPEPSTDER